MTLLRRPSPNFTHALSLITATAVFVLMLVVLSGCAALQPAKTFEQQLAYAYGTHTALLDAAANAVSSGALSSTDAEAVLKIADDASLTLDAARVAVGVGDLQTAEAQLKLATNVLTELRNYLNTRIQR